MQFVNITVDTSGLYQVPTSDKGTVAIVGLAHAADETDGATVKAPVRVASYAEVLTEFGVDGKIADGDVLSPAIKLAFANGASSVWAVDVNIAATQANLTTALDKLAMKDVQCVMIANAPASDETNAALLALADHVAGGTANATERVGVFMLAAGDDGTGLATTLPSGSVKENNRLIGIAHNNGSYDVAAAVSGLLSSLDPWESPVMKSITGIGTPTADFTNTQFTNMAAAQINPIFDPLYYAGSSLVLKTEYTLGATAEGIYLVDVRRVIDDIVYKLKTGLTVPAVIGGVRINKAGMASLRNYINSIMQTAVNAGEIDSFSVNIPVATALAVAANSRTAAQATLITNARTNRTVDAEISIEYSGAVHTLDIDVLFSA